MTLQDITKENLVQILKLKVADAQEKFVATNAVSIAQSHFYPEVAWFRAIYADAQPIGFVMLEDDPQNASYSLWRLMVDTQYQKQGFGRKALELVFEYVKIRPGAKVIMTSCVPGEGSPGAFYEKMGFTYTGETDEDGELMMQHVF
ncbi:GNAT family N-acetyltransferase [Acaryochloris marina NIES-2412]|uniref:GNAT family N-acetyltransferase n=1 Tax=Acaryochloris marina TaxID=155978 RepID=UPI004058BA06